MGFSHLPKRIAKLPWHPDEDAFILQLVDSHGKGQWTRFASVINTVFHGENEVRKPKEIRSRFINRLNPNNVKGNWSVEEDMLLQAL